MCYTYTTLGLLLAGKRLQVASTCALPQCVGGVQSLRSQTPMSGKQFLCLKSISFSSNSRRISRRGSRYLRYVTSGTNLGKTR